MHPINWKEEIISTNAINTDNIDSITITFFDFIFYLDLQLVAI